MSSSNKPKVIVLYGGQSSEHEISCRSASFIIKNIDPAQWDVLPVGIDKEGKWWPQDPAASLASPMQIKENYLQENTQPKISNNRIQSKFFELCHIDESSIKNNDVVIFSIIHGQQGEDGRLQSLFELADVPYVGCGVLSSAMCMDKVIAKLLVAQSGISVVPYVYFSSTQWKAKKDELIDLAISEFGFPMFVKPSSLGSSVGISKAEDRNSLIEACRQAFTFDHKILIEKAITPNREVECAMIGNNSFECSTPGEISTNSGFYSYESKYLDQSDAKDAQFKIPAELSPDITQKIKTTAEKICTILEVSGMARVDFFYHEEADELFFNEVNTLPGFTEISQFPALWAHDGVDGKALINKLLAQAIEKRKNSVSS